MSSLEEDSSLDLAFGSWSETEGSAPAAELPRQRDLPILDLDGSGPFPSDLTQAETHPTEIRPRHPWSTEESSQAQRSVWWSGDVLMCPCPDCHAPMSIRLWLMVADCWQCGTSIELSEQQMREVERLLRQREAAQTETIPQPPLIAAKPQPKDINKPIQAHGLQPVGLHDRKNILAPCAHVTEKDSKTTAPLPPTAPPKQPTAPPSRSRAAAAARKPSAVRAKLLQMAQIGSVRVWLQDWLKNLPAWFVSFLFHLVLLTLLGLLTIGEQEQDRLITLSVQYDPRAEEGGDVEARLATDDVQFDLPVPDRSKLKDEKLRQVILQADQDAKEIRLDPLTPAPELPQLSRVKQAIRTGNIRRASLAARDPRVRVEMVQREGGTTLTEAAVARGLRWLANHQNDDGSWSLHAFHRAGDCNGHCSGHGRQRSDSAATSLVLLPFLGAGQTHLYGRYKNEVARGLRWLLRQQNLDGDLRADSQGNTGMYAHGQGTIVLCEVYAITGDERFRHAAQDAVDFIVSAQHANGGWRYRPGQAGDTSVLGWQLMALQSAIWAGLEVPEATMENAGHYLDSVQHQGGALYGYQRGTPATPVMTAEALLCRVYLGWTKQDPELMEGIDFLVHNHLPSVRQPNVYYWYYATQTLHHVGGVQWELWNLRMRNVLVSTQQVEGHQAGSWAPRGGHAPAGGRLYMTALATCTLEVYYRHLPIFRQIRLE